MLKIRDDVNLEELLKFGFKKETEDIKTESGNYEYTVYSKEIDEDQYIKITNSRHICIAIKCEEEAYIISMLSPIYDLIQAGLVETPVIKLVAKPKIEIGDYIRSKYGLIHKVKDIKPEEELDLVIDYKGLEYQVSSKEEWKVGKTKIEIIEEGDYVNGEKVAEVYRDGIVYYDKFRIHTTEHNDYFEENIESIVTKELFKEAEKEL